MLKVLNLAVLVSCLLQIGDAADCQKANAETDKNLQIANTRMITDNFVTVDVDDFQEDLRLTIFGWRLPWNVSVEASSGLLGFGNMSRTGDSTECLADSVSTLNSLITYDHAKFRYRDSTVKFLYWKADGQLSYKFRPTVNATLTKDATLGCRVSSSPMHAVEQKEFEFKPKSWKGWFLGKLLQHVLWYAHDTPMTNYFLQASHSLIGTFLTDQWCTNQ